MEVKPGITPYIAPAPVMPIAPMPLAAPAPVLPHHDHIHLHAAYKHTTVLAPVAAAPVAAAPVVPYTSTASILVLFILLVIITRSFFFRC
jgi:hypothetical protein